MLRYFCDAKKKRGHWGQVLLTSLQGHWGQVLLTSLIAGMTSHAQSYDYRACPELSQRAFGNLDVGLTVGTVGIGLDVGTHINRNISLRAGFSIMPPITMIEECSLASVNSTNMSTERVNHLLQYMRDITGNQNIDDVFLLDKELQFWNGKLLLDWYPFRKKNFHFTVGAYFGSMQYAKSYNDNTETSTMVAINIYNRLYDTVMALDEGEGRTISLGAFSFESNSDLGKDIKESLERNGRIAVFCGYFPDGTPYCITPDPDGVIRAHAESFAVKPYLSCGYNTNLGGDRRWTFGVELGALFWSINNTCVYTSDNVCLVHDVENCHFGDIKLLKHLPVYPNLEVRLAYRIF